MDYGLAAISLSKQTTTYVLTCGGLDGSRSYSATVNVGFIPKLKEIIPKLNFWYKRFGA
ncbi:hypothetical protein HZB06_03220 [Candidatus Wolfebacteria bacterium]|nr:hypothetical protein [Candidatus Wolfebacteria bacterium]